MSAERERARPTVLFIEDRDDDVVLELAALRAGGLQPQHRVVEDWTELRAALAREQFDLVIADYHLPSFSGIDALKVVREFDPDVPVILVSGTVGEQTAVEAMRAGVNDYVLKDALGRLAPAAQRELRELQGRRARRRAEAEQRFLTEAQLLLAELGRVVAGSLDAATTLRDSVQAAVPLLGPWALGYLLANGTPRLIARAALDAAALPAQTAPAADAAANLPLHTTVVGAVPRLDAVDEDELARLVAADPAVRSLRERGEPPPRVVPLHGRDGVLGALVFGDPAGGHPHARSARAVARDIGGRVGLAVENALLFAAAQEGLRVRDEFLAMLGHELRNPLAPIVTAVELMKLREPPGTPPRRELVVIERQTRYLIRLVDDLLDIARVTRGKVSLERRPMELAVAVTKSVEAAGPLIAQRRHQIVCRVPARGLQVDADEIRLSQVLTNLLTNAARYTPEGGRIEIDAARQSSEIVVTVRDNGMGIAPELLPRLFDSFVQGHRGIDRSEGGLGLGLALVRNLVELHGGSVAARSDGPGRGAVFTVRLPALASSTETPGVPSAAVAESNPRVPATRVLVVDDNADAAEMLAAALTTHGCQVRRAHDAHEALALAEASAPDAAVLDIGLPGIDGYELATRLRARFGGALRLIALTGYGQPRDAVRAQGAGFDAHLIKPVDVAALLAALSPPGAGR